MNLAFLVEGSTEFKLYPKWINHLSTTPFTECTTGYHDVVNNQFTIFDVTGIGKMGKEIIVAINEIIANPVFDYLVIVVDADDNSTTDRLTLINGVLSAPTTPTLPSNCRVKIIVQQVCIETWFIGHTDHFRATKTCRDRGILAFMAEYDAENNDPELMPNAHPPTSIPTSIQFHSIGAYHTTFLKRMLRGANRTWRYGKSSAHNLIDIPYFQRLEQRLTETPTHLKTFADMVTFMRSL
jgi:hypothetical protein